MDIKTRIRGFTLIELIITLSLLMLILGLGVPSMNSLIAKQGVHQTADLIVRAVHLSRSEAIRRGNRVILCFSNNSSNCNSSSPEHLLIFNDPDHTGAPTSINELIQVVSLDTDRLRLHYNRSLLAFSARGHAAGTNGTFTICSADGQGAMLVVSILGRIRQAVDYDGDGVVEKTPGNPINCPA